MTGNWCRVFLRLNALPGPMTFNSLPNNLRDPSVSAATFGQLLKTPFLCLSARLAHWGCLK